MSHHAPADWIVYPHVRSLQLRPAVRREATFQHAFSLEAVPAQAPLAVRGFRRFVVRVNGEEVVHSPDEGNWKVATTVDAAQALRAGQNELTVTVDNDSGPPALWLSLQAGDALIVTDDTWQASSQGATTLHAVLADAPLHVRRSRIDSSSPPAAAQEAWPLLAAFAALSLLAWGTWTFWHRRSAATALTRGEVALLLGVSAALWVALCWHNRDLLAANFGFDVAGHVEYVKYLANAERAHLVPRADEGWEMFQPPLYYAAAAGLLRTLGLTADSPDGTGPLRAVGLVAAIAQCWLVLAGLRLLFPERSRPVLAGFVLTVSLPMQLYVYQYVTNEGFAATWATAALVTCLWILRHDPPKWLPYIGLGLCLGAALLAKATALIVALVILAVLAGRLLARRETSPLVWFRSIGVALVIAVLVAGWHYLRAWIGFGNPLIANWDPETGVAWYQDPGYHTRAFFVRFGSVLRQPYFATAGLADALYSTLWGDGMAGGSVQDWYRPPWNQPFMTAGYLLALLPSTVMIVGCGVAVVRLVRKPSAEWFLMLGTAGALLAAIITMNLRLHYVSMPKAFFALSAALPLAAFAGWGFDACFGRGVPLRAAGWTLWGCWAIAAYLAFWIPSQNAFTQRQLGWSHVVERRLDEAQSPLEESARLAPQHADTQVALGMVAQMRGEVDAARRHYQDAIEHDPHHGTARYYLAMTRLADAPRADVIAQVRRALDDEPDHGTAYETLAQLLGNEGEMDAAIGAAREALRVNPTSQQAHLVLGALLAAEDAPDEALEHWITALEIHGVGPARDRRERRRQMASAVADARQAAADGQPLKAMMIVADEFAREGMFPAALSIAVAAQRLAAEGNDEEMQRFIFERIRQFRELQTTSAPGD